MAPPPPGAEASAAPPFSPGGLGSTRRSEQAGTEARGSIPLYGGRIRRTLGFVGPGYLVAVGYMDPGNWATGLAGGSAFGYQLLWIVMLSNGMAIFLQILSARLGIATGLDLAQACREHSSKRSAFLQWVLSEIAICATDLAEVLGTAIALNLLFNIPLSWGVALTALDVFLLLWLQRLGYRFLESVVISLVFIIFICFGINLALAGPDWHAVALGFVPARSTLENGASLYVAIGIIGATVMPHNLYLHSSIVQTRGYERTVDGKRGAIRSATIDVVSALMLALLVNSAILITAAAAFYQTGHRDVVEIGQAFHLLAPLLGTSMASVLFGVALLASGLSSTLTATLAGQVVMEGYLNLRLPAWQRRLLTRCIAIVPALLVTATYGESGIGRLLILSQVILSLQLPFAVVPLIRYTSNQAAMGTFANSRLVCCVAWLITLLIISLNVYLVASLLRD
jgi:manganese transport protein